MNMMNPWMLNPYMAMNWDQAGYQGKGQAGGYGKGKGKGKGLKGMKGMNLDGKGKWKGGDAGEVPEPPQQLYCRCCGKEGHAKSKRRHLHKACNNCEKTGHIVHMCTAKIREPANDAGGSDA